MTLYHEDLCTTAERIVFKSEGGTPLLVIYGEPDYIQGFAYGSATRVVSKSLNLDVTLDMRLHHAVAEVDRWSELGKLKEKYEEEERQLRYSMADKKAAERIAAEDAQREAEERARIGAAVSAALNPDGSPMFRVKDGATKDGVAL